MRILFFGTAEFAVPTLDALMTSQEQEVIAIVTQPDKPQGRGRQMALSPIKQAALRYNLPLLQPRRVRAASFLEVARQLHPDVLVLAAFGQIIPQALLDLPPFGPINVHGSLLPAYRGAAPIQRAIMNGEDETGVTTMWMDAGVDTGDILLTCPVPISDEDTTGTLTDKMAQAGAELLLETLALLEERRCPRTPQNHSLATHAPPVLPEDSRIQWGESARRIRDRIRALAPRPGAFTDISGKRVKLWSAGAEDMDFGEPGVVQGITKQGVKVGTGQGGLTLQEVQPENSRRMQAADWARGARITPGSRFV